MDIQQVTENVILRTTLGTHQLGNSEDDMLETNEEKMGEG